MKRFLTGLVCVALFILALYFAYLCGACLFSGYHVYALLSFATMIVCIVTLAYVGGEE